MVIHRNNGNEGQRYKLEHTCIGICRQVKPILRSITISLHVSILFCLSYLLLEFHLSGTGVSNNCDCL